MILYWQIAIKGYQKDIKESDNEDDDDDVSAMFANLKQETTGV